MLAMSFYEPAVTFFFEEYPSGVLWCVSGDSESKVLEEVVDASTLSASISVGA